MKKSMDLIWKALNDYYHGEVFPFIFEIGGKQYGENIARWFRSVDELSNIENKMISMCSGDILDVWCGTGNYIPKLDKMWKVLWIDISPKIIEVAKKMWRNNCIVWDIFTLKEDKKFDTITMFKNNLWIWGTVDWTKKLLKKVEKLMKLNGQILIILSGRAKDKDYLQTEITPVYIWIRWESFKRITFNKKYLRKICDNLWLSLKVLSSNRYYSFVRITKK